jgi:hypothetical protein
MRYKRRKKNSQVKRLLFFSLIRCRAFSAGSDETCYQCARLQLLPLVKQFYVRV